MLMGRTYGWTCVYKCMPLPSSSRRVPSASLALRPFVPSLPSRSRLVRYARCYSGSGCRPCGHGHRRSLPLHSLRPDGPLQADQLWLLDERPGVLPQHHEGDRPLLLRVPWSAYCGGSAGIMMTGRELTVCVFLAGFAPPDAVLGHQPLDWPVQLVDHPRYVSSQMCLDHPAQSDLISSPPPTQVSGLTSQYMWLWVLRWLSD